MYYFVSCSSHLTMYPGEFSKSVPINLPHHFWRVLSWSTVWDTIFISLFYKWLSTLLPCFSSYKQCSMNILVYKSLGTLLGVSERPIPRNSYYWVKNKYTIKMLRSTSRLLQDSNNLYTHQQSWKAILCTLAFLIIVNLMNKNWQPVGLIGISLVISEI